MFERYDKLCRSIGKKPSAVAKELGIDPSTITHWKKGDYTPRIDKLQKIAQYFGISVQYLISGEDRPVVEIPADETARDIASIIHANPVLIDMIYDFADITESWEQRLKGYYDALSNYEQRRG